MKKRILDGIAWVLVALWYTVVISMMLTLAVALSPFWIIFGFCYGARWVFLWSFERHDIEMPEIP